MQRIGARSIGAERGLYRFRTDPDSAALHPGYARSVHARAMDFRTLQSFSLDSSYAFWRVPRSLVTAPIFRPGPRSLPPFPLYPTPALGRVPDAPPPPPIFRRAPRPPDPPARAPSPPWGPAPVPAR